MSTNYVKVFELKFTNTKELSEEQLLKKVIKQFISKKTILTRNGTFYIKDIKNNANSITFLFGKDNDDASNYKREKKNLNITKLKINEKTETLTDFVHIGISKKKRLGSYVLLLEKSKLISHYNIKNFIDSLITDFSLISLSRRVTKDFYNEVKDSKRIVKIRQISKKPKIALATKPTKEELEDIDVEDTFEIKAKYRKNISVNIFESVHKTNLSNNDTKLVVDIVNQYNHKMVLDFDLTESPYTIRLKTQMNLKNETIQQNINDEIDYYIGKDNKGLLH